MDFVRMSVKETREGLEVKPSLLIGRFEDVMYRGGALHAIYDPETGMWKTSMYDFARIIDDHICDEVKYRNMTTAVVKRISNTDNGLWSKFVGLVKTMPDNFVDLDPRVTFKNSVVEKNHYATKRLEYDLSQDEPEAWDVLIGTLYKPEEREKLEWAIGSIFAGASADIQKFYVLYGKSGTGKSTALKIVEKLFAGYSTWFVAGDLANASDEWAMEPLKDNPLVAIEHDSDLSKVTNNQRLNSIVSHESMIIKSKFKSAYPIRLRSTLFMGTNNPVKITNRKSGLLRRLIDINPSGVLVDVDEYQQLMGLIDFELGAIANRCLKVFEELGPNHYDNYRAYDMMYRTNALFNFVQDNDYRLENGGTVKTFYALYLEWCEETATINYMNMSTFRDELKDYFAEFHDRITIDGERHRSYFKGLNAMGYEKQSIQVELEDWMKLTQGPSLLDTELSNCFAQYASDEGVPTTKWASVKTKLHDLDTSRVHYVLPPKHLVVVDFDLTDENGEKDFGRNMEAARRFPATYAESSQGGNGIHLSYWYDGDVNDLDSLQDRGIEIKVFRGSASLRRRVNLSNNHPIAHISSGLKTKEKKGVLGEKQIQSEASLRNMIERNLKKEIHPYTKMSISFIHQLLEDAHTSGMSYDVSDLKGRILRFATSSTNQALACRRIVMTMKFQSESDIPFATEMDNSPIVDFDVESFPNLFVVCWLSENSDEVAKMINPTAEEIHPLLKMKLRGFYNRQYDNHMLYAASLGYTVHDLYQLSQKLVSNDRDISHGAKFGAAYDLSYADVYDYASEKKPLKKWEIELGLTHMEIDLPWDQPVPEDRILEVVEYCANDVWATRQVAQSRDADFKARLILSDLSGLSPNHVTRQHVAKIIFGNDKDAKKQFNHPDLSVEFPGYTFDQFELIDKSMYRGENPSEGGYVYAEPGYYENVALLDVQSMHPTSIVNLNLFGSYTQTFKDLMDARVAIKKGDLDVARGMLDGRLQPYLNDESQAAMLAGALKLVLNSVYGYTAARFDNPFLDRRNIDNVVAKRGALFMIDLKHFVQEQGFTVAHIKTDSIKIPNATPEIIEAVKEFGIKYGYIFEHEETYDQMLLVNNAVYVANVKGDWSATGAQFQNPYVFKSLFRKDREITLEDYAETKQVTKGSIYLMRDDGHTTFVGRIGKFLPTKCGRRLLRIDGEKEHAVTGTKDHLWELYDVVVANQTQDDLDETYHQHLLAEAISTIENFVPLDKLIGE